MLLRDRRLRVRPGALARGRAPLSAIALLTAISVGCSPAPMPMSQSSRDPSSPSAAEGSNPMVFASSASVASSSDTAHAGSPEARESGGHAHQHGAAAADAGSQGVVYVCPMHPEVTSNAPDRCPKCNMKLVPKK